MLAFARGQDRGIQAGSHELDASMDASAVLQALQAARASAATVTVVEGLRLEEVAAVLEASGVVPAHAFVITATDPAFAREPSLGPAAARPPEAGLEGYLFPDTYELAPSSDANEVVLRLISNFATRYANAAAAGNHSGLSDHEVVTLASIVQREAVLAAENGRIARTFLNRLGDAPGLLGADPTVQYALGLQPERGTWWKRPLTETDLASPSSYNTYVTPGLPPGPIANPGSAALEAVLRPEDGAWRYFVANEELCDGSHVFAETFDEHAANVARYRTGTCVP
jgi:UPF0755 protein